MSGDEIEMLSAKIDELSALLRELKKGMKAGRTGWSHGGPSAMRVKAREGCAFVLSKRGAEQGVKEGVFSPALREGDTVPGYETVIPWAWDDKAWMREIRKEEK